MKLFFVPLLFISLFFANQGYADIYTATTSGNYSSSTTWFKGNMPPSPLGNNTIEINDNVVLNLDQGLELNTTGSIVSMMGSAKITGSSPGFISYQKGKLVSTTQGEIDVDSFFLGTDMSSYKGKLTVDTLMVAGGTLSNLNMTTNVLKTLRVDDLFTIQDITVELGQTNDTPTVIFQNIGYLVTTNNGGLNLSKPYNVLYEGTQIYPLGYSKELQGTGLNYVTVDIGTGNTIKLLGSTYFLNNAKLVLASGTLSLEGYFLYMRDNTRITCTGGDITDPFELGTIYVTSASADVGVLKFAPNTTIGSIELNSSNNKTLLHLASDVTLSNTLNMKSGILDIGSQKIYVKSPAVVANGSINSYVTTGNGGMLQQDIAAGTSKKYPMGQDDGYSPLEITAGGSALTQLGVAASKGVQYHPPATNTMPATNPHITTMWTTYYASGTTPEHTIEAMWETALETGGFARNSSYLTQYNTGYNDWEKAMTSGATVKTGLFVQKRENVTTAGNFAVFDNNTVSVADITTGKNISIYPNPATDVLHIDAPAAMQATISNMQGQVLLSQTISKGVNNIDIHSLPAGIYNIRIMKENKAIATARMVK